jgi:hypothetical protein
MIMPGAPGMSTGLEMSDLDRFINNETVRIREALEAMGYPGVKVVYGVDVHISIGGISLNQLKLHWDTSKPHGWGLGKEFIPDPAEETASPKRQARNQEKRSPRRNKNRG